MGKQRQHHAVFRKNIRSARQHEQMVVALHGRAGVCGGTCGREAQFGPRRAGRSGRGSGSVQTCSRAGTKPNLG